MSLKSYFYCADNDYKYFMNTYKEGYVANAMGYIAQNICERYMKHIIEEFYEPQDVAAAIKLQKTMKSHSLSVLSKFLKNYADIKFSTETERAMLAIDGFYFSSRYPDDNYIDLDKDDVDMCCFAVCSCRTETLEIIKNLSKSVENIIDDAKDTADKINDKTATKDLEQEKC